MEKNERGNHTNENTRKNSSKNSSKDNEKKVVLVTGSGEGIGRGVAGVLASQGMHIAGLDIDAEANAQTAAQVEALGGLFLPLLCDVGDKLAVKQAVDAAVERFGKIDVLINNAGYWDNSSLIEGDYESQTAEFDRAMGASGLGSYYVTRACIDHMSSGSNIIGMITDHIKPDFLITGSPAIGYDCAKFSMWRQTETWAIQLQPRGIRVNGLCFGAVDTPMLRGVTMALQDTAMQPEDIGQAVLNILAHPIDGPTGQTWLVAKSHEPREVGLREIAELAPS